MMKKIIDKTETTEYGIETVRCGDTLQMKDKIVKSVIDKYEQRSEVGIKKYNKTMERDDLSLDEWLTHLQEELMDATLYIEKLKKEIK